MTKIEEALNVGGVLKSHCEETSPGQFGFRAVVRMGMVVIFSSVCDTLKEALESLETELSKVAIIERSL